MTTSDTPAKQRAQDAASTAADEGKHVAGVAKEEAKNVAGEAATQARNLVGEAKSQVSDQLGEQSRTQRDKLVGTLQTFSNDLEQMVSGGEPPSGLAADLAREIAERARSLGSALDGREPQDLLNDVRSFARRRPGTFLLGALAAGMVVGRVARGAKQGTSDSGTSGSVSMPPTPTSTAPPITPPRDVLEDEVVVVGVEPTIDSTTGSTTGVGTGAAGYGQRGTTGEERTL